jgi:hypothetical protein
MVAWRAGCGGAPRAACGLGFFKWGLECPPDITDVRTGVVGGWGGSALDGAVWVMGTGPVHRFGDVVWLMRSAVYHK